MLIKCQIDYPDAIQARYEGIIFETDRDSATGYITRDYGFIFSYLSPSGERFIVVCGILAFGSQIAVETLLSLSAKSEAGKLLYESPKAFIAILGHVDGFEITESKISTHLGIQ